ncbi:heparinase II/III family protein [Tepidicaulis sp. LMO-SS28]|uniref:heparinase II/III family protein n=1 Tax=Tepidicaulis sp. LMO-SS28 TaxID=3447455 RepID=UPI003EE3F704
MPAGNRLRDLIWAALAGAFDHSLAWIFSTKAYRLTLRGPMPDHMVHYPKDLRPGRADKAAAMMNGRFDLPGGQVKVSEISPFLAEAPSETWAEELHGFSWARHLSARGDKESRQFARLLVENWVSAAGRWHPVGWRPHVIGRRLISWVANGRLLMEDSELVYRSTMLRNMAAQARHLSRVARLAPPGEARLTAALGLAFSGLCLSDGPKRLAKGLKLVCEELERQILPDGGHVSRSPAAQLSILLDLVSLREALIARRVEVPLEIRNAIDRMMPMLRFFRHGDGKLALFNGSNEGPDGAIDAVLAYDDTKGKPFGFAPHSGYQRLAAGPSNIIVDTGPPPPGRYSHDSHAGCLSFELSAGRSRIVVNCGDTRLFGPDWRAASRATAAHSTLVVEDTSSARFTQGAMAHILLGPRLMEGPARVESRRNETPEGILLEASHNGYETRFGLIHRRRLFLSASGEDLRGEDQLLRIEEGDPPPWAPAYWKKKTENEAFAIRFHLHPEARASLAHDGSNVLVLLGNGDGWQFRARVAGGDGQLGLEDSVYLGGGETTRRAEQIVVSGRVFKDEAKVQWAWRRLSTRGAAPRAAEEADLPAFPDFGPEFEEDGAD